MSWQQVKLGDIFKIARGGSPRPIDQYITDDPNGLNWISIKDASNSSKYIYKTEKKIKPEGLHKTRLVHPDDFLLTNSMSFGRPYIMKTTGCIHDGWLAMEDIDEKLDKIFLLYSLNQMTEYFRKTAPAGTQPNLNTNIMKMHRQIVPPMEMQKAFISFVKCADRQKQIVQQSLEKLELMKKALMQEYFG